MKSILLIISIALLSTSSYACDCFWGGNFIEVCNGTDLVVKVKVLKKLKDKRHFNHKMEVEIIETFKGKETSKIINVWGDDGKECRPYIDYFETGGTYYLSLHNYNNEYEVMNCGETYLQVKKGSVYSDKRLPKEHSLIGKMRVKKFESQLKSILIN